MSKKILLASILFCAQYANLATAASCDDNFTVTGNFLTGKTYKTWADVPDQSINSAFTPIASFTRNNGFKILESDKERGSIAAVQAVSYANGKKIPLDIAIEPITGGVKVSMIYITPMGVTSPEDATKAHFCKTIAAAASQENISENKNTLSPAVISNKSAVTNKSQIGVIAISPEQADQIKKETEKKTTDAKLRALIADAAPTIQEFIGKFSCLAATNDFPKLSRMFTIYAAPGKYLVPIPPMNQTPYHNKNTCLNVARIQAWQAPALNALKFEVVYLAEDSGESTKTNHEMVRQPDGVWLFNQ